MRKRLALILFLIVSVDLLSSRLFAKNDFNYVIDLNDEELISNSEKKNFNKNLSALYKLSNQRIVILLASDNNGDENYALKAYRELRLKGKDFLIIIKKDTLKQVYFFQVEFDHDFYQDPEMLLTMDKVSELMRYYFNQSNTLKAIEFALDTILDLSQSEDIAQKFQSYSRKFQDYAYSENKNETNAGNSTALILGIIFLVFLRITTLSGQMIEEVRSKKQANYDIFYSRQFSSSRMVSFFLILARLLRFTSVKTFHGGSSGGGGAGGQW